jgi:hypothetical protein
LGVIKPKVTFSPKFIPKRRFSTKEKLDDEIDAYMAQMAVDMPNTKIILTGYVVLQPERKLPVGIHTIPDFQSLIDLANA